MRNLRSIPRGFTLMELMISIGILAIIAGLAYGSFQPIWLAKEEVEIQSNRYHAIRLAMQRMTRDVSMAFLTDRYDTTQYRQRTTHFVGKHMGNRDSLRFTALSNERLFLDARESDQAVIEYRIANDPEERGTDALIRRVKPVIDDRPEDGGSETVLVSDVGGLIFEYWDVQKEEWVTDWDTDDRAYADRLPQRVRITLIAKGDDDKERRYTTQAMIVLQAPVGR